MSISTKDHLDLKTLRGAFEAKVREIEEIGNAFKVAPEGVEVTTEQHAAYVKAITEAEELKQLIAEQERVQGLREFLDGVPGRPAASEIATKDAQVQRVTTKSLADAFFESESWQALAAKNFKGDPFASSSFETSLAAFGTKDVYSTMAGEIPINALGRPQDLGLTPRALRPGRVRDLFPVERTTANLLYGIRETGFVNRAAVVPERRAADGTSPPTGGPTDVYGLKPRSELTLEPVIYPVATIAHVMYAHRNTLADEPRMRGLIDRDLVDGVKLVEDFQLLYGDGVGDNLTGICNTPGIQVYTGSASDPRTAQIRRAITRAILAFFPPTGIVLHPLDWEDLELETDNNGQYRLVMNVAVGAEKRIWRLDVVDTVAMNEGQYLIGAFGTGAKVYDRESVNIAVSTENRDMFERNAVTIRAEERIALVVDRPESFVLGTLTTPS